MFSQFKEPKTLQDKLTIVLILFAITVVLVLVYSILGFFLYYWPLTLAATLFLLYHFLRMCGRIMMFPGYFNYYKGSIESSYSKEANKKLSNAFVNLQTIHRYLVTGVFANEDRDSLRTSDVNFGYFRGVFQKFKNEGLLSKNKLLLLEKMNQID